jgi:Ig-like domain from next to BRCA1 gene
MIKKAVFFIALTSLLYACGPTAPVAPTIDVSAIHTAAAETVIAEFTQTAQAIPPTSAATATEAVTSTPQATTPPTATVVPTNNPFETTPTGIPCDDAIFVDDVTVPDGTEMTPGQDFVKTWKIRNTGSCTWGTGYSVIFAYGEKMSGVAEPVTGAVAPGEEVEVSVRFKAPDNTGEYSTYWRMANASSIPFGENIFMLIVVR